MRQSKLFTKTRKEAPTDEVSKSARLLIQAGFIHKEMAGVYDYLPLGLKVIEKIRRIVKEEMDSIGGEEVHLTSLQDPEVWKQTGRFDDEAVDNWFKTKLKNETELGLAFTHEEPLSVLMKDHINSYRDLPVYVYQFQTKFRNELRAKSGIMRGREFLMKDLYSFSADEKQHQEFYEKAKDAYKKIFERVGIGDKTYLTFASGGSFSKYSHEFQTLTDAGEDQIFIDNEKNIAINKEVLNEEVMKELGVEKGNLKEAKSVEVGNIFTLGTKFSEPLELKVDDGSGKRVPVFMGSYGIGLGRLMGTIAEVYADEEHLVWPETVAPFKIHLINVSSDDENSVKKAEEIYNSLCDKNVEVFYDDRNERAGEKLGDAELIGLPVRVVVGKKSLETDSVEIFDRSSKKQETIKISEFLNSDFCKVTGSNSVKDNG